MSTWTKICNLIVKRVQNSWWNCEAVNLYALFYGSHSTQNFLIVKYYCALCWMPILKIIFEFDFKLAESYLVVILNIFDVTRSPLM
jgi:hypothetical protein